MRYRVTTGGGDFLHGRVYSSEADALLAIASHYCWAGAYRSDWFSIPAGPDNDDVTEAFAVYATEEERDEDGEGNYAPRVVEVLPGEDGEAS